MSLDETGEILAALAHPLRRRIVRLLEARREASYSELLRELGVESSTLSFHLKKLGSLVEKSGGLYRLTPLGLKASRILQCIEARGEKPKGLVVRKDSTLILDDDLLLEAYKSGGLLVEAPLVFVPADVSRSLYKKTVREIEGIAAYVPRDLYGYTTAIAKCRVIVPYTKKPFDPAKPLEAVKDLEKRGYTKIALELKKRLGIPE